MPSRPQQSRSMYYLDSSVLLNLFLGSSRPSESGAAKRLMDRISRGAADGIVSMWTLMEIITVVRKRMAERTTDIASIETKVEGVVAQVYRIRNLKFVSGTPSDMNDIGGGTPELWRIFQDGLEHLSNSLYTVEWNRGLQSNVVNGIGGSDALHIMLARLFECDSLATFDKGFWADDRPITIYDVMNDVER